MALSVFLRPFLITDAERINRWRNDENIQRLTCGRIRKVSLEIEKEWVMAKIKHNVTEEYFAICLTDDTKEMIGYLSLNDIDYYNRKAHIGGIVIDPEFQVGTFMIDAQLLILEYAFETIGMNRLSGACLSQHKVSRIMMEALGFQHEGTERQAVYKFHRYNDVLKFALLYEDYSRLKDEGRYKFENLVEYFRK